MGAGEGGEGFRGTAESAQGQTVIEMIGRRLGSGGDSPGEQGLGLIDGTLLQMNLPEEMKRVGLVGVGAQNAFVEAGGLGQPAGAVMLQGLLKERGCRDHGGR